MKLVFYLPRASTDDVVVIKRSLGVTMGNAVCRAGLHLKPSNTLVARFTVLTYVLLVGLVSRVSPQLTYQRACDCEYMVNGKCAYTLLLPTSEGSCPGAGAGAGSETIDYFMRNITNRVNNLYDLAMNQSMFLIHVQDSIISLQRNNQQPSSPNDSAWRERQEAALALLNATFQSGAMALDQLKTTTEMLTRNLSNLNGLLQLQMAELSHLQLVVNETKDANISQLLDTVKLLRQATCNLRGALFSGPDRLNGTSISVSSSYNNESANYGPHQIAIDNTGTPGAWCPQEPHQNEWVQFDIGRAVLVYGVATRGRNEYDQWMTSYSIQYVPNNSSSGVLPDGSNLDWAYFTDVAGANQVFQGNTDRASIQLNMLWRPITTRFVRLRPLTGASNGNVCMRAEIIGCVDEI